MFDIIILNLKCTNMISAIIRWPPKNNLVEEIIYFLKSSFFFFIILKDTGHPKSEQLKK